MIVGNRCLSLGESHGDWKLPRNNLLHSFEALLLSEGRDILALADEEPSLVESSAISVHTLSEESAPPPYTDSNIEALFALTELRAAQSSLKLL